jgi:hypothetical protein
MIQFACAHNFLSWQALIVYALFTISQVMCKGQSNMLVFTTAGKSSQMLIKRAYKLGGGEGGGSLLRKVRNLGQTDKLLGQLVKKLPLRKL